MAKGNMLQGMARGKVGDVVFSRLNGEQISRVRNRHPKNPKTNAQLYQRAVMATVMQAYSAGRIIFDHAFQGKEVGAANQRRFMKLNAKLLRSQIAADIDGDVAVDEQVGRVVAPGIPSPVPAALQVSEGTLINNLLGGTSIPVALDGETLSQYCSRIGLVAGDLFTFVGFVTYSNADVLFEVNGQTSNYSKQYATSFVYARYAVKASALTSTEIVESLDNILELTDANFQPILDWSSVIFGNIVPTIAYVVNANAKGVSGWIRSRVDEDLRSNTQLAPSYDELGIASQFALDAWKQGAAALGNSDLILEGGDE